MYCFIPKKYVYIYKKPKLMLGVTFINKIQCRATLRCTSNLVFIHGTKSMWELQKVPAKWEIVKSVQTFLSSFAKMSLFCDAATLNLKLKKVEERKSLNYTEQSKCLVICCAITPWRKTLDVSVLLKCRDELNEWVNEVDSLSALFYGISDDGGR